MPENQNKKVQTINAIFSPSKLPHTKKLKS